MSKQSKNYLKYKQTFKYVTLVDFFNSAHLIIIYTYNFYLKMANKILLVFFSCVPTRNFLLGHSVTLKRKSLVCTQENTHTRTLSTIFNRTYTRK